jgi:hypothetical protein
MSAEDAAVAMNQQVPQILPVREVEDIKNKRARRTKEEIEAAKIEAAALKLAKDAEKAAKQMAAAAANGREIIMPLPKNCLMRIQSSSTPLSSFSPIPSLASASCQNRIYTRVKVVRL